MRSTLSTLACLLSALASCGPMEPDTGMHRHDIRPTDGAGWNGNGYGAVPVEHWDTPGGKFRIHYATEGRHRPSLIDADASGAPDFVEEFGKVFDEVYKKEVTGLGFRPPLDDSKYHDRPDYGGDGRFDVYLQDTAGGDGHVVVEACTSEHPFICAGYMIVENDFFGYPYKTPHDGMEVLASHEFFHIVQNTYRTNVSHNFSEATAVWMTEQVYPHQDDFDGFMPAFFQSPDRSLDHHLDHSDKFPYGLAIWAAFLADSYGADVIRAVWEELSEKGSSTNDLDAIDKVLARDHESSLAEAYATFALWNLMTGKRAAAFSGHKDADKLPEVALEQIKESALPFRISDTVRHLAARYYRIKAPKDGWIRVASERPHPALAVHLVAWPKGPGQAPEVSSALPDAKTGLCHAEIQAPASGEVLVVAAATSRDTGDLPLSLAVTPTTPPETGGPNPPPPDETGNGGGDGGCALASQAPPPPPSACLMVLIAVLYGLRRRG